MINASHVLLISLILLLGATIHACRPSGCHIVALECDADIFKEVLMPLRDPEPLPARSTPCGWAPIPDEPLQKRENICCPFVSVSCTLFETLILSCKF